VSVHGILEADIFLQDSRHIDFQRFRIVTEQLAVLFTVHMFKVPATCILYLPSPQHGVFDSMGGFAHCHPSVHRSLEYSCARADPAQTLRAYEV
jgi:hypothetical protein